MREKEVDRKSAPLYRLIEIAKRIIFLLMVIPIISACAGSQVVPTLTAQPPTIAPTLAPTTELTPLLTTAPTDAERTLGFNIYGWT
jgi:hypothetical protein